MNECFRRLSYNPAREAVSPDVGYQIVRVSPRALAQWVTKMRYFSPLAFRLMS